MSLRIVASGHYTCNFHHIVQCLDPQSPKDIEGLAWLRGQGSKNIDVEPFFSLHRIYETLPMVYDLCYCLESLAAVVVPFRLLLLHQTRWGSGTRKWHSWTFSLFHNVMVCDFWPFTKNWCTYYTELYGQFHHSDMSEIVIIAYCCGEPFFSRIFRSRPVGSIFFYDMGVPERRWKLFSCRLLRSLQTHKFSFFDAAGWVEKTTTTTTTTITITTTVLADLQWKTEQ